MLILVRDMRGVGVTGLGRCALIWVLKKSSPAEMANEQDLRRGRLTRLQGGKRDSGRRNSKRRPSSESEASEADAGDRASPCHSRELD